MGRKLIVLYDAGCALCCSTAAALERLNTRAELKFLPLQNAEPDILPPGIRKEDLLAELHVVDETGNVYKGAAGIVEIVKTAPMLVWLGWLYRLPGMKGFADVLYRWIAKRRYRLFGRPDSCRSGTCFMDRGPEKQITGKDEKNP